MITKEQEQSLAELEGNTHTFWTTKKAVSLLEPFGLEWIPMTYEADYDDPKGLHLNDGAEKAEGAASWDISAYIADAVGAKPESKLGRGFQVRADCKAIRDKLNEPTTTALGEFHGDGGENASS